ncbi:MFS transporter [Arsenicicoccus bolidensis]|uniref:MFS transporter n=1 Tax=Arsenicicoccus bolidensis TaxID=229480 RepID=UPI0028A73499|nr:MFS transporter [Arsenicicoccus bolidensis]
MKQILHTYVAAFSHRDAVILLAAGALSTVGDAMALVALTLRTHDTQAGPYAVAGLLVCFALPLVLTMGIAGSVADRADSRTVLVTGSLVQAAAAGGLALTTDYAATLVLVALLQTAFAFTSPLWTSLLPLVAGDELAGVLVSLRQGLRTASTPVGAAAGGLLVQHQGASAALAIDAASFLALTVAALLLRTRRRRAAQPDRLSASPGPALRILRGHPTTGILVAAVLPFILTLESVNAVEVYLLRDVLHANAADYGWAEAAAGVSATVGALLAGTVTTSSRRARLLLGTLVLVAANQAGQGLAISVGVFVVLGCVVGGLLGATNTWLIAVLLAEIPDRERGRVLAAVEGAARACTVAALALGGTLNLLVGPRTAYLVVGAAGLAISTTGAIAHHRATRATPATPAAGPTPVSPGTNDEVAQPE